MKTIVGLYDNMHDAEEAITDLVQAGFDRSDISLMATDRWSEGVDGDGMGVVTSDGEPVATIETDTAPAADQMASDVATGAVTGGVVGGVAGVLLGLGVLAIPGFGPVLAAGPLVAGLAGAGLGAAVGGLVGALVSWGVPEDEAELYAEGVRRGSILVGVKTADERAQQAVNVMNNHGPVDVQRRSEYWRASGWTGYDPNAPAWADHEIDSDRRTYGNYLDYSAYTPDFRKHYQTTYGTSGHDYNYYDPAYRYGYTLANDERYRDMDSWDEVEDSARSAWETGENAARGAWDDFKDAVRRGWEDVKDAFDTDTDYANYEPGYQEHYRTTYGTSGHDYNYYDPAYRYGYTLANDERYRDMDSWDEVEDSARNTWETGENAARGAWDDFKDAVRRGWEEVKDAFDMEADYADFEPGYREHYQTAYGNSGRDYDWYGPAYRYGYNLAMDERWDDYDTWDEMEAEARRDWESHNTSTLGGTWDDFKDAIRRGWEDVKDAFDAEDDYYSFSPSFREHYDLNYANTGRAFDVYDPAYRYGYNLAIDDRTSGYDSWDQLEASARSGWTDFAGTVDGTWDDFKDAVRHAWEEVKDALDIEADYAGREERYHQHYETLYRNTLRDYSWYEPAYRHGYIMGMDERYDNFDTWQEAEAQAREDWEKNHPVTDGGSAWDEIKEAVHQGWDSVREAFDNDDDVALPPGTAGAEGYFRPTNS